MRFLRVSMWNKLRFDRLYIIGGFVLVSMSLVFIHENVLAQAGNGSNLQVIQEGNTLKLEYTPASVGGGPSSNDGPPIPPVEGVPQPGPNSPILEWGCKNNLTPGPPNQQCHAAYEDRLGCNGGGAGKRCDTTNPPGSSATACICVDNP